VILERASEKFMLESQLLKTILEKQRSISPPQQEQKTMKRAVWCDWKAG